MKNDNRIDDDMLDAVSGGTYGRATENEKKKARLAEIEEKLKNTKLSLKEKALLLAEKVEIMTWLKEHGEL